MPLTGIWPLQEAVRMFRLIEKYEWAFWSILIVFYAAFCVMLASCATSPTIYERKELTSWELRPRPGHIGLTSQRCVKYEKDKCVQTDLVEFDLNKDEDRARLHDARFVCRVEASPRPWYRVCSMLHGLCQQTEITSGPWYNRKTEIKLIAFLDINTKYQYLLDNGTYCVSLNNPTSLDF